MSPSPGSVPLPFCANVELVMLMLASIGSSATHADAVDDVLVEGVAVDVQCGQAGAGMNLDAVLVVGEPIPEMETVALPPAVELISPVRLRPSVAPPVLMMVEPAPEPMMVSSLSMVAPAYVPGAIRIVSPALAASTAA